MEASMQAHNQVCGGLLSLQGSGSNAEVHTNKGVMV